MSSTNKKFDLKKFKKIYIMVPANVSTGGPEALHQLGFVLKNVLKKDIKIFYIPTDIQYPVHKNYKKYSLEFTDKIEDNSDNVLIVPEYYNFLKKTLNFKNIKKVIWWLSIDNYIGSRFRFENSKILRSIYKLPFNSINFFNIITNFTFGILTLEEYLKFLYNFKNLSQQKEIKQASFHFTQSYYAKNFLMNKLEFIEHLSDFIREDLLDNKNNLMTQKENIICYNPQKSNLFMNLIIKKNDFKFIPLINLNNDQIINILSRSKIYMDIGSHPGKDRLPREAALLGNCVITNLKGSALNNKDISIPSEFKFRENYFNLKKIGEKIQLIFDDYENEFIKFHSYIEHISNEKDKFIEEVKKVFK